MLDGKLRCQRQYLSFFLYFDILIQNLLKNNKMDIKGIIGILMLITPSIVAIILKIKKPALYKKLGSFWMITWIGLMLIGGLGAGTEWLIGEFDGTNKIIQERIDAIKNPYDLYKDYDTSYPELLFEKVNSSKYNPDGYSFWLINTDEYGNDKYYFWYTLVISEDDYREIKKYKNVVYLYNSKYGNVFQREWDTGKQKLKKLLGENLYLKWDSVDW